MLAKRSVCAYFRTLSISNIYEPADHFYFCSLIERSTEEKGLLNSLIFGAITILFVQVLGKISHLNVKESFCSSSNHSHETPDVAFRSATPTS